MQITPISDDTVRRTVAVLSTVAHLQCATIAQIHALCFPFHTLATVRLTLRYLAEAHFVDHSRWIYRPAYEGQVWILTAKGHRLIQSYASSVPPLACIDLQRPETAHEQEEWRVRHLIRRLIVGLLLEARQYPLLHSIDVQLLQPTGCSTSSNQTVASEPDGYLRIAWRPSERKAADWLPWFDSHDDVVRATEYPIYVDRSHAHINLQGLVTGKTQSQAHDQIIPMFVLADEQRCRLLQQCANTLTHRPRFRMTSWSAREGQVSSASWMDVTGMSCGLQPLSDEVVA